MTKPNAKGNGYWQGQTDAKLEALSSAVNEIKITLERIDEKLEAVRLWRAKVAGISVAASAIVAYVAKLIWGA
jgi:hypothetical protein